jgi:hypothetical protein
MGFFTKDTMSAISKAPDVSTIIETEGLTANVIAGVG